MIQSFQTNTARFVFFDFSIVFENSPNGPNSPNSPPSKRTR